MHHPDLNSDDPNALFEAAEALRKAGNTSEAQQYYQAAAAAGTSRSRDRGDWHIDEAVRKRRKLGSRLWLGLFLLVGIGAATFFGYRYLKTGFERQHAQTDPKDFQFVEWLAQQQSRQILSNIVQANPELSFDFSRSTALLDPAEALKALMQQELQDRIRSREQRASAEGGAEDGDGGAQFQCTVDPVQSCPADQMPTAAGEKREELSVLVRAYRSTLSNEKDCTKIEAAIDKIGEQMQWRKTERDVKSDLVELSLNCYSRDKNYEKAIEQARKLQCTADPSSVNTTYWYLTSNYYHIGDKDTSRRMYQCFKETVSFLTKYHFEPAQIAARHRESGALAWLYFDDLKTAMDELENARNILKEAQAKAPGLAYVLSEIDLDLMETYVTANIDQPTFEALHSDINTSGMLNDGYKQIKDTLAGIYYLQNRKQEQAAIALENVATRFKHLPEYICSWDWSGFQRGLKDSIKDPTLRAKADQLVVATDCYVPQAVEQRIASVREVVQWLKR